MKPVCSIIQIIRVSEVKFCICHGFYMVMDCNFAVTCIYYAVKIFFSLIWYFCLSFLISLVFLVCIWFVIFFLSLIPLLNCIKTTLLCGKTVHKSAGSSESRWRNGKIIWGKIWDETVTENGNIWRKSSESVEEHACQIAGSCKWHLQYY